MNSKHTIKALRNRIRLLEETLEKNEAEMLEATTSYDHRINSLRQELNEARAAGDYNEAVVVADRKRFLKSLKLETARQIVEGNREWVENRDRLIRREAVKLAQQYLMRMVQHISKDLPPKQ